MPRHYSTEGRIPGQGIDQGEPGQDSRAVEALALRVCASCLSGQVMAGRLDYAITGAKSQAQAEVPGQIC